MIIYGGTFLEFFEFVLFATLFPVLSKSLNIHFSPNDQVTLQYLLFWCGFMARPLGALLLLKGGDQYNRKSVLIFSIVGMAFTTMLMGCAPIYVTPIVSILFIAIIRLTQGVFTGIELASATIYAFEQAKSDDKNKVAIYMGLAATLGTATAYLVAAICQLDFMEEISFWRAAFLLSGFAGLWIGGLRLSRMPQDFINRKIEPQAKFRINKQIVLSFFVVGLSYAPFYYISTYLNIYPIILDAKDSIFPFLINACIFLLYGITISLLVKQQISDKALRLSFLAFIMFILPASYMIFEAGMFFSFPILILLIILSQVLVCGTLGHIPGVFNDATRLRSFALVQSFAASIFGGATPLICHAITQVSGYKWLAGGYIALFVGGAYFCYVYLSRFRKNIL